MDMMEAMDRYQSDFSEKLTEKDKMIFKYAFKKGMESLQKDAIEVFNIKLTRHHDNAVRQTIKSVKEAYGIICDSTYITMTFPFYLHYQITIKGKSDEVEKAKHIFEKQFETY